MAKITYGVRLDEDLKAALDQAAKDDARTTASLINKILRDWIVINLGKGKAVT